LRRRLRAEPKPKCCVCRKCATFAARSALSSGVVPLKIVSRTGPGIGKTALAAELADERERDAALTDDAALVRYQAQWERRIARLQRAHPARWRVPGLSSEETRDALTLRLIEVLRQEPHLWAQYDRPGKAWALSVVEQHLATLRKAFRLGATPTDFQAQVPILDRSVGFEEQCLEHEADLCRERARQTAERALNVPLRRWLSAMKLAARGGEFFAASAELNLSAASRVLGKNRSSAQRAYRELQVRFQRERDRVDE
jgi:hypothetical protein